MVPIFPEREWASILPGENGEADFVEMSCTSSERLSPQPIFTRKDRDPKIISSMEGEDIPYDLLVLVPPHRGASVIAASGMGDEQGWLPTDRNTLLVKGHEQIYAIGDATDLPVSKSGSAAHFQAKVVAHRLIATVRVLLADHTCSSETN